MKVYQLPQSKSQTLITGVYRTGSEYLTLLLDCHPNLSATMYRVNALRFTWSKYKKFTRKNDVKIAVCELNKRLKERYGIDLPEDVIVSIILNKGMDIANFYDAIMSYLYLKDEVLNWAEKCQLLWREIDLFLSLFANGKAIHIIRDPRSVLASFKNYTNFQYPACLGAIFNCFDSMKYAVSHKVNKDIYVVKYEDILDDRDFVINSIWSFLGLSTGHEIDLSNAKDAYGNPWFSNSSFEKNFSDSQFDKQRAKFGWHEKLNYDEISLTEYICGNLMQEFNYEISRKPSSEKVIETFINSLDNNSKKYFELWKQGFGIQQFPANPILKETWDNHITTKDHL